MWQKILAFDLWLIEKIFEPIGFWSQMRFGINAKMISRFFALIIGANVMIKIGSYWQPLTLPPQFRLEGISMLVLSIFVLLFVIFTTMDPLGEGEDVFAQENTVSNPRKIDPIQRWVRLSFFFGSIFIDAPEIIAYIYAWSWREFFMQGLCGLFVSLFGFLSACFFYFSACDIYSGWRLRKLVPAEVRVNPVTR